MVTVRDTLGQEKESGNKNKYKEKNECMPTQKVTIHSLTFFSTSASLVPFFFLMWYKA